MNPIPLVVQIMNDYAEVTGISGTGNSTRRYLWTDAFAVFNFLTLHGRTGVENWLEYAFFLIEKVHDILGQQRTDSSRTGWISGLKEAEGRRHPTVGGLRIGKRLRDRDPSEPYDPHAEWDRDGQYYHYLTKWMLALNVMSRHTKNPNFSHWAIELAKSAHAAFVYKLPGGYKRMYWKMSTDLSYPLVTSMGQSDPLDGLIAYMKLQDKAFENFGMAVPDLENEIKDMETMCEGIDWVTGDPLGIGGLLVNICHLLQLMPKNDHIQKDLLNSLLESSYEGLRLYIESSTRNLSAEYRLPFRELGLAIGMHGIEKINEGIVKNSSYLSDNPSLKGLLKKLEPYIKMGPAIENFWLDPENRMSATWIDHADINSVMLATSLAPDSYIDL